MSWRGMTVQRTKRITYGILAGVLLLQLAGCEMLLGKNREKEIKNLHREEEAGATEQKKQGYDRSATVILDVDIDFSALGIEYYDDAVELYQDRELSNKVYCQYEWDREGRKLSLLPPAYPLLNVSTLFASKAFLREYEHSDYFLFEKGDNQDWGNLGRMFLVRWIDLQTGDKLDKPDITEIEIEGELDRPPNFQFEVSEYGNGILSWESVEDAECYLVVKATYLTGNDKISGFYQSCDIIAETEETTWQPEDKGDIMNREFRMYTVEETDREYYYGVIAVGKAGTSMVSSLIPKKEMAQRLPFCKEENGYKGELGVARFAKSIDLLSRYQWIQLCDGTMSQHLLQYKIEEAKLISVDDGDGRKEMLQLPYTVVGTEFEGSFYVETFDRKSYQEDLKNLQKRQHILKSKMDGMLKDVEIAVQPEKSTDEDIGEEMDISAAGANSSETGSGEKWKKILKPMGTTKLSRYLAACLLKRDEYIAVSDIQEIPDREALIDAFYEAYYQNPLIPAVREISVLESGEALNILYEEDSEIGYKKQQQVMEQVEFVAGELEEEGMTDLDKVLAINSYLCDTVVYDTMSTIEEEQRLMTCAGISRLHYSEAMTGQSVDEVFTDSMTPFGALVNHRGVCLAYAGAFQLLARAMGLDSIVVTGTLNGNQNHAWNKVKIDGKWCVLDVTSNDDQDISNTMLNISDKTAELVLKEDDHYLCDDSIEQYSADTDEYEYYHLSGKDYEKDKIAEAFVHALTLGKKAVFRTDAALTNAEFQSIVKEVMDDMEQIEMQGYYHLGVIYLERK